MKITEKQLLILLQTLEGSLRIAGADHTVFALDHEGRLALYNDIINQQEGQVEVKND